MCNLSWTPHSNLEKDNSLKTTPVLAQRWSVWSIRTEIPGDSLLQLAGQPDCFNDRDTRRRLVTSFSSFISAGQLFQPHRRTSGGLRVGGGVHDSYTFQCGLMGYFTSPGIDTI